MRVSMTERMATMMGSPVPSCLDSSLSDLVKEKATLSDKYQLQEGYEITFVKQPPQEVQLECSICLQFLSEPCLVDCECGNSFCRECIQTIRKGDNPCPLCNQKFDIILPNKQLNRVLNSLHIYCPHKEEGCQWTDELGKLFEHFNVTPTADSRLEGCELTSILCTYCNEEIPRRDIPNHEANLCPDKPYTCQYCGHSSIYNDITDNHWPVCCKFPVPCPFNCGETPQRQDLEVHVASQCESVPTECEFRYAGCEVELPRKDMSTHLRENIVEHMSLLASSHRESLKEVQDLKEENLTLKQCLSDVQQENILLTKRLTDRVDSTKEAREMKGSIRVENTALRDRVLTLERSNQTLQMTFREHEGECTRSLERLRSHLFFPPVRFTMDDYKQMKRNNETWHSPSFYTHEQGYKMCLEVCPNGSGDGYRTHMSVFVCLLKGKFDSILNWPFTGDVTIKLLDQRLSKHHSIVLSFDEDDESRERNFEDEIGQGWGYDEFMEYKYLPPNFLRNDCVMFEITKVTV